jgi:HEAT repeat protein
VNEAAVVTGLARALLLMGDPEVLGDAQREFNVGASIPRRLGWVDALGLAGGRAALPLLLGWAAPNGGEPSVVRARAVRALGLLAAPGAGDWARSLARVLNPLAPLVTFSDPFQGGILDLAP